MRKRNIQLIKNISKNQRQTSVRVSAYASKGGSFESEAGDRPINFD